jgi:multidrug resistance efflux pump
MNIDVGGKRISIVSGEERGQALADQGAAAGRATSAAGQIAQQKAMIEQLKVVLEHMSPVSPFDGVVTALYVEQGTTAHNGQPLIRVVGGQGLRARIAVPEESAGVWVGRRRAQLEVEVSGQTRTFWSVIDQVAPEVEPASRAFFVEGPVSANTDSCAGDCALLAGRPVRASLISDKE